MPTTLDLDTLVLHRGAHAPEDGEVCLVEAAALINGDELTDHPACVSTVIGAFCRAWNDALDDDTRQHLKPWAVEIVGTGPLPDEVEAELAWMATDWLVRVHAPAWLRLAGLTDQADLLAGMPELTPESAPTIKPVLAAVRSDADAAGAAARAAARDAAGDAAGAAAGDAAGDAAWDAAWDAAGAAARDAARDAAGDAAGAAAWAAAWDAAWAAAWDAAWDAARAAAWDAAGAAAWDAARDAAWDALAPTTAELQVAAWDLLARMVTHARNAR